MLCSKRDFPALDPAVGLLICCALFPVAGAGGYFLGQQSWRKNREPLLQKIQSMQAASSAGETPPDLVE